MKTSVIIPAYNEADRLPSTLDELTAAIDAASMLPIEIGEVLVVDDGSSDGTIRAATAFSQRLPALQVLENGQNFGKGRAIRTGLQHAGQDWCLIADADGATPWEEASKLGERAGRAGAPSIAIGSRDTDGSRIVVRQSAIRESLGRSFNTVVRLLTPLPFRDTQCGFKLIHRDVARSVLGGLSVDRFAWDVELLLLAMDDGVPIFEVPVTWEHKGGSRIHLLRDGLEMGLSLLEIRARRGMGRVGRKRGTSAGS